MPRMWVAGLVAPKSLSELCECGRLQQQSATAGLSVGFLSHTHTVLSHLYGSVWKEIETREETKCGHIHKVSSLQILENFGSPAFGFCFFCWFTGLTHYPPPWPSCLQHITKCMKHCVKQSILYERIRGCTVLLVCCSRWRGISAPPSFKPRVKGSQSVQDSRGHNLCVCVCVWLTDCVRDSLHYADTRDAMCFHPVYWRTNAKSFFMRVPTSVCFLAHLAFGLMRQEAASWRSRSGPHQRCCKRKMKWDTCLWCSCQVKRKSGCNIASGNCRVHRGGPYSFSVGRKRPLKQHFDHVTSKPLTWNQYQWNPIIPWNFHEKW